MITIEQLLESVNYQIEPKWVTKDKDGTICIFGCDKPKTARNSDFWAREEPCIAIHHIKLAEFEGKDWTKCIYEVPRKVDITKWIGKLCRFWSYGFAEYYAKLEQVSTKRSNTPFFAVGGTYWYEHCEPVRPDDDVIYKDTVNELKGAKNE